MYRSLKIDKSAPILVSSILPTICVKASLVRKSFDVFIRCEKESCNKTRWVSSETRDHEGDKPASNGKRRRISSQKPWMVFIFNNSGSSIYLKNIVRACAMSSAVAGLFSATPSSNSISSSSDVIAHFCNSVKIRFRISPAAALVYVRHKIPQLSISSLRNNMRSKRCTKTLVFPVPAFA